MFVCLTNKLSLSPSLGWTIKGQHWEHCLIIVQVQLSLAHYFPHNHVCQNCDLDHRIAQFYDLTSPKSLESK